MAIATWEFLETTPVWSYLGTPRYPDKTKILVVYNTYSGATFSEAVCTYYCNARGIPLANMWGFDFGSTTQMYAGASVNHLATALLDPFWEKIEEFQPTGIILGPQTPPTVAIPGGTPSIYDAISLIKWYRWFTVFQATGSSGRFFINSSVIKPGAPAWVSGSVVYPRTMTEEYANYYLENWEAGVTHIYSTHEIVGGDPDTGYVQHFVPKLKYLKAVDEFLSLGIPVGRLGWTAYSSGSSKYPETQAGVEALIDSVTPLLTVDRTSLRTNHKSLIQFKHSSNPLGIAVHAFGRTLDNILQVPNTTTVVYTYPDSKIQQALNWPASGEDFAYATPPVGETFDIWWGDNNNDDYSTPPYSTYPAPNAGAVCMSGASNGWEQTLRACELGGAGGITHTTHWGPGNVPFADLFYHLSLAGMTLLEMSLVLWPAFNVSVGDPLYAPFGGPLTVATETPVLPSVPAAPSPTPTAIKSTGDQWYASDERERNFRWLGRGNPPRRRR